MIMLCNAQALPWRGVEARARHAAAPAPAAARRCRRQHIAQRSSVRAPQCLLRRGRSSRWRKHIWPGRGTWRMTDWHSSWDPSVLAVAGGAAGGRAAAQRTAAATHAAAGRRLLAAAQPVRCKWERQQGQRRAHVHTLWSPDGRGIRLTGRVWAFARLCQQRRAALRLRWEFGDGFTLVSLAKVAGDVCHVVLHHRLHESTQFPGRFRARTWMPGVCDHQDIASEGWEVEVHVCRSSCCTLVHLAASFMSGCQAQFQDRTCAAAEPLQNHGRHFCGCVQRRCSGAVPDRHSGRGDVPVVALVTCTVVSRRFIGSRSTAT